MVPPYLKLVSMDNPKHVVHCSHDVLWYFTLISACQKDHFISVYVPTSLSLALARLQRERAAVHPIQLLHDGHSPATARWPPPIPFPPFPSFTPLPLPSVFRNLFPVMRSGGRRAVVRFQRYVRCNVSVSLLLYSVVQKTWLKVA